MNYIYVVFSLSLLWAQAHAICDEPINDCTSSVSFYLVNHILKKLHPLSIDDGGVSIENANFVKYEDIKFLIVDRDLFKDDQKNLLTDFIAAYAELGLNVLLLDYFNVGSDDCVENTVYPSIPQLGKCAANFVDLILKVRPDIQLPQFHVVAYDTGVHIAAYMTRELQAGIFRRLTALEPVKILSPYVKLHLSHKSAQFVDVYFTNAGKISVENSDAHIEVYFNNGVIQERCSLCTMKCSHSSVIVYFTESIRSSTSGFFASKCVRRLWNGCIVDLETPMKQVGEYATPENTCVTSAKTIYTVLTNQQSPYALGYTRPNLESTIQYINPQIFRDEY